MNEAINSENEKNLRRYDITAWFYDILDYPWEQTYRKWRPVLVGDLRGAVLEAGVGTGRNLEFYHPEVDLTAFDQSPAMLRKAARRKRKAKCSINLMQEDACRMSLIGSQQFDWVIATFLCCVVPSELQVQVLQQIERVLKPGGRFRLLEMIYSKDPSTRKRQDFFAPFVEKVYGARFDRDTVRHVETAKQLEITSMTFLKKDVYLLIEGFRRS
jgi:ubiquinone/menaquinone biosynthesis C-methylase UbiE